MSKSDENPRSFVSVLDDPASIVKKFKSAVTDSETEVCYRDGKDGINNLMTIYSVITGLTMEQIERDFAGKGYGDFKKAVGEAVADHLAPVRENFARYIADKGYLESCYKNGAERAEHIAERTLAKMYKKVGFVPAHNRAVSRHGGNIPQTCPISAGVMFQSRFHAADDLTAGPPARQEGFFICFSA
jgi:tryptophanyl-tRNA synthetase